MSAQEQTAPADKPVWKVLVVGGTGMIGCHVAWMIKVAGHDVTIGARREPEPESVVAGFPMLLGDYAHGGFSVEELRGFDAVVMCAAQDVRHARGQEPDEEFWRTYQSEGVPAFFERAKAAGVSRAVQIGSYYHVVRPDLVDTVPYVRARRDADVRSRALADESFVITTINPPSVVGSVPGRPDRGFAKLLAWGRGELDVPDHAPAGGTNFMSARSLADAVVGALENGRAGEAYLVGDSNLTHAQYFQLIFDQAGAGRTLEERDEEHPFLPDSMLVAGRGTVIAFEPDPAVVSLLGYRRGDVSGQLEKDAGRVLGKA